MAAAAPPRGHDGAGAVPLRTCPGTSSPAAGDRRRPSVVLWLTASVAFASYTAHVGTYDRLYGPLAGFIVFLVWLWVSNLALLTGAQFNAELARTRAR
ncbi:YhjD/YihY/BrkB family envelope integrity protein [Streptomyces sp. NPDC001970]